MRRVLILATLLAAACGPPPPGTPAEVRETIDWGHLGTWSGRGDMQTESFLGEIGALRLRWETRNPQEPGAGSFHVTVHSAVSGRTMADVIQTTGAGAGTAFVSDDPHLFYLVIDAHGLDWSIIVEEPVARRSASAR